MFVIVTSDPDVLSLIVRPSRSSGMFFILSYAMPNFINMATPPPVLPARLLVSMLYPGMLNLVTGFSHVSCIQIMCGLFRCFSIYSFSSAACAEMLWAFQEIIFNAPFMVC